MSRDGFSRVQENSDGGFFAINSVAEISDVAGLYVAAFYLDDDTLCLAGFVVRKPPWVTKFLSASISRYEK